MYLFFQLLNHTYVYNAIKERNAIVQLIALLLMSFVNQIEKESL